MSVSDTVNVKHIPIQYDDDKRHLIIGRWIAITQTAGDASGGAYIISHVIGSLGNLYGQHCLWDLRALSIAVLGTSLVSPSCAITVQGYEQFGGLGHRFLWICSMGGYGLSPANFPITSLWALKLRTSDFPGDTSKISTTIETNAAATTIQFATGGYVYDERMLTDQ